MAIQELHWERNYIRSQAKGKTDRDLGAEYLKTTELFFFLKLSKLITLFMCIQFPLFIKQQRNLSMPSFPEGQDHLEANSVTSVVTGLA